MSYGGVHGHEGVNWDGRTRVARLDTFSVDHMAEKVIHDAAKEGGYEAAFAKAGATRRSVAIKSKNSDTVLVSFYYEARRGGVVAVRIRRLISEHVHPAQWPEHMPYVIKPEEHISWTTGGPEE